MKKMLMFAVIASGLFSQAQIKYDIGQKNEPLEVVLFGNRLSKNRTATCFVDENDTCRIASSVRDVAQQPSGRIIDRNIFYNYQTSQGDETYGDVDYGSFVHSDKALENKRLLAALKSATKICPVTAIINRDNGIIFGIKTVCDFMN